ncbi:uncharacterized protein LOC119834476 [Zerene cesonia]|uniref:uncharacterized protein LOC119834476 n=1 Tax=Zerene cesonia TaxID=33412 RepID=UPI0018E51B27|nr:uncharacterized protein LOC119834476 [Zerene cesonia]
MDGLLAFRLFFLIVFALCGYVICGTSQDAPQFRKLEIYDGVYAKIPDETNNTTKTLISFEVNLNRDAETGRGKQKKLLERILPMFVLPFLIQSTIIPLFLGVLKFMLFKSLIIGKLALVLIIINAFKNGNSFKGRDADIASLHYGYKGHRMEEYGSYFNT